MQIVGRIALLAALAMACAAAGARAQQSTPPAASADTALDASSAPNTKKKKAKRKKLRKRDGFHFHTEAAIAGGALLGHRERPRDLGLLELSGLLEPSLVSGDFALSLPIDASHRQTFPDDLIEHRASALLQASYRIAKPISVAARAGVVLLDRPGWPDFYQPTPDGLLPTDRYSSFTRRVGAGVTLRPARKHWVRLDYDYRLADYTNDPAFEAIARPNHLTPFDHERHDAELDYHMRIDRVRLGVGAEAFVKSSFFVFARDARTGFTHAGPGGRAANPLQELRGITPYVEAALSLLSKQRLTLELRYAHALQEDTFQGYYSFRTLNPRVALRARPVRRLELSLSGELWLRTYGEDSYAAGLGHPALDEGSRRRDDRFALELEGQLRVHPSVAFTLLASYTMRDTNFPDYEPGVFPASQAYDIAWDYENVRIEAGVTVRKNWF